ncbi:major capsid protein [Marinobacter sp. M1N3S26]|uniref:major capsid protein n=1 Tax=Marinobacter sp. M1N3S26 TaxID=3382299 RepID=UPI00387AA0EC
MAYETTTLLNVMSELDRFSPFLLNLLFQSVVTFDTEEIAFDELELDETLAPFVSPYIAGKPNREKGGALRKFVPPTVKPKDVVKPGRALKRRPGEDPSGEMTAEARMNAIRVDLLDNHRRQILRRMEWMVAQLLRSGKIVVEGEDYPKAEVDYGRDPNNTITLAAGAEWGSGTEDVIGDHEDWFAQLAAPCTHVIYGRGAFRRALLDEKFKDLVETERGSDTEFEIAPAVNLASYRGRFGGAGPELWSYTGYFKDDEGNKELFIPDNGVVLLSTGAPGVRAYGAILDKKAGFRPLEYFPKNWDADDPSVEYLMTQSRGLPVPGLADSTLYATVFTP